MGSCRVVTSGFSRFKLATSVGLKGPKKRPKAPSIVSLSTRRCSCKTRIDSTARRTLVNGEGLRQSQIDDGNERLICSMHKVEFVNAGLLFGDGPEQQA